MNGLALRDDEGVVHWAPFSDLDSDRFLQKLIDDGNVQWSVSCEGHLTPRIVAGVAIRSSAVTCLVCLERLCDLD